MDSTKHTKKSKLSEIKLDKPTLLGIIAVGLASVALVISILTLLFGGGSSVTNKYGLEFYPDGNGGYIVSVGNAKHLSEIVIPARHKGGKVVAIDTEGFANCSSLTSITIPNTVTKIGDYAFEACDSLTEVKFGSEITEIGLYAFSDCTSLKNVNLTESITSLGEGAFYNCLSLTEINIPESVISVGDNTFTNCDNLKFTEYENAYYLGNPKNPYHTLVRTKSTDISEAKIHPSAKIIYYKAFAFCLNLNSVDLPEGVTEIGVEAFYNCTSLKEIIMPASLLVIQDRAFYECSSINEVNYTGTEAQLDALVINYSNDPLMEAMFYFNYSRTN